MTAITTHPIFSQVLANIEVLASGELKLPDDRTKKQRYLHCMRELLLSGVVKLVIFDLDNTLWQGTLSENEDFAYDEQNMEFVKSLVNAGIMCSICTKNDRSIVEDFLKKKGMWNYFIFPQFGHLENKGTMVCRIITATHFRPQNVFFVDDEERNIKDVSEAAGVHGIKPEFILCCKNEAFPENNGQSRLQQYKMLEQKTNDQVNYASAQDFLVASNIQVTIVCNEEHLLTVTDRIYELIHRTNQLNFTKIRMSKEEINNLIRDKKYYCGAIYVKDIYGDYGLVGFYCLDKREKSKLIHFLLSCRVLGMKVEASVYKYLGSPDLEVKEPIAKVDLCEGTFYTEIIETTDYKSEEDTAAKYKVVLKGNCTLQAIVGYIQMKEKLDVSFFANPHTKCPDTIFGKGHSSLVLLALLQSKGKLLSVPEIFEKAISTEDVVEKSSTDFLVLQFQPDLWYPLMKVPLSPYIIPIDFEPKTERLSLLEQDMKALALPVQNQVIPPEVFLSNLVGICENVSAKFVIVLTFPEIAPPPWSHYATKFCGLEHIRLLNTKITEICSTYPNVKMLDLRHYVTSFEDTVQDGNIFHFKRIIYFKLATELHKIMLSCVHSS